MKMSELGGRGRGRHRNKPAESRFVTGQSSSSGCSARPVLLGGVLAVSVIVPGHLVGSMREGGLRFFLHLCHAAHKGISGFNSGGAGEFRAHTGVLSSIEFKGGVVGGGMDVVVVCKLCDW